MKPRNIAILAYRSEPAFPREELVRKLLDDLWEKRRREALREMQLQKSRFLPIGPLVIRLSGTMPLQPVIFPRQNFRRCIDETAPSVLY